MCARSCGGLLLALLVGCAGGSDNSRDTAADIGDPTQDDASTGQSTGPSSGTATTASAASTATSGDDENCVPGQQIECACPGGSPGAQACLPDGSGFGACECAGEDTGTSTMSMTTTASDMTNGESGSDSTGGSTECEDCANAALQRSCGGQLDVCVMNASCAMMAMCVQACGLTINCSNDCSEGADDVALPLFQDLIACVTDSCPVCGGN